jgi:hypothetical protein
LLCSISSVQAQKAFFIHPQKKLDSLGHLYDYLVYLDNSADKENLVMIAAKNGNYGLINEHEKVLLPFEYEHIFELSNMLVLKKKGKYGFVNPRDKKWIINCIYNDYRPTFVENTAFFVQQPSGWGCINQNNQIIFPCQYETVSDIAYNEDAEVFYLIASQNQKQGIVSNQAAQILPFEYENIQFCGHLERFIVQKNQKYGLLNNEQAEVLPFEYEHIRSNYAYFARHSNEEEHEEAGYTNASVDPCEYTFSKPNDDDVLAWVEAKKGANAYLLNVYTLKTRPLKKFRYESLPKPTAADMEVADTPPMFWDDEALPLYYTIQKIGQKYALFCKHTQQISVPALYDSLVWAGASQTLKMYLYALKDGKWGIIDTKNQLILPLEYEYISGFNIRADAFAVLKGKGYGLVNSAGEALTGFDFLPLYDTDCWAMPDEPIWAFMDIFSMEGNFLCWDFQQKKWLLKALLFPKEED